MKSTPNLIPNFENDCRVGMDCTANRKTVLNGMLMVADVREGEENARDEDARLVSKPSFLRLCCCIGGIATHSFSTKAGYGPEDEALNTLSVYDLLDKWRQEDDETLPWHPRQSERVVSIATDCVVKLPQHTKKMSGL